MCFETFKLKKYNVHYIIIVNDNVLNNYQHIKQFGILYELNIFEIGSIDLFCR